MEADGGSSGILVRPVETAKYDTRSIEAVIKASPYLFVAPLTSFWFPVLKRAYRPFLERYHLLKVESEDRV
jgi:hypothetical protein